MPEKKQIKANSVKPMCLTANLRHLGNNNFVNIDIKTGLNIYKYRKHPNGCECFIS